MADQVRCESIEDLDSGKYYLELYYPIDAEKPFLTTAARYESHQDVESAAVEIFKRALPDQSMAEAAVTIDRGPFPDLFSPKVTVAPPKKFTPLTSLPFISLLRAARRPSTLVAH